MTAKKTAKKAVKKAAKASTSEKASKGFTEDERAAMRERARELKAQARGEDDEGAVLSKLKEMAAPDRIMGERIHALIKKHAPELAPRTWYGMPAYAKDGNVVCFFQAGTKFKTRYSTLGFSDKAALDEGDIWPSAFALNKLTPAVEAKIVELIRKAVG